ncbi:unnamed protein product [Calicophoron daubneyi]|uniref:5'-nucleotidase n=1 Tax=Calicophoron daubneyi TaxID=300641 RepID=A0AAV2TBF3_CALDB
MTQRVLNILHFNDVYNVEEQKTEPRAGAARFRTALKNHGAGDDSIVLFSGDALSPSSLSTVTHGRHMPVVLNDLLITCAVIGNHDLDFGLDLFCECMEMCKFPWLNSNVFDQDTNELLANTPAYHIVEKDGLTIGIIGLVEKEWVATLSCMDTSDVYVEDVCECGRRMARMLKQTGEDGRKPCDLVIALTHMRWPNDRKLGATVPEIDMVLGGHDHEYGLEWLDDNSDSGAHRNHTRPILKSGTDFRTFSHIKLTYDVNVKQIIKVNIEEVVVDSRWDPDDELTKYISTLTHKLEKRLDVSIGRVEVPLDARFCAIRTRETNVGNFLTDIILTGVHADLAIINSGTLRADKIFPPGDFTIRDLLNLLPMLDSLVVLQVTGKQIVEALENGVSQYPKQEGRFPLVSGVRFTFDAHQPPGNRVVLSSILIQGEQIDLDRNYRICVKHYLATGRDGYTVFADSPVLINDDDGPIFSTLVQNYFRAIQVLRGFERCRTRHRQSIVAIAQRHRLLEKAEGESRLPVLGEDSTDNYWRKARRILIEEHELRSANVIAPKVDGRITILNADENLESKHFSLS